MNKKAFIFVLFTALTTGFIFFNSFQDGLSSNEASGFFLMLFRPLTDLLDRLIDGLDWNFIIRKGAHFTEFLLLGVFTYLSLSCFKARPLKLLTGYGLFYVLAVAVTDEFIQSFTGRTSSVRDVALDFFGALVGILFIFVIRYLSLKKKISIKEVQNGD